MKKATTTPTLMVVLVGVLAIQLAACATTTRQTQVSEVEHREVDDIEQYLGVSLQQWNQIRSSPDYTSANDATNMDGIVVVDGHAVSGEKFNGNDGRGLIYVDGDMEIAGNFVWRGLIYVEGNCEVTGTVWVLGAIIVRGTTTNAFAAGNSTILYSRDAINTYVGSSVPFVQLGWKEI